MKKEEERKKEMWDKWRKTKQSKYQDKLKGITLDVFNKKAALTGFAKLSAKHHSYNFFRQRRIHNPVRHMR